MKHIPSNALTSALVLEHEALNADFQSYNHIFIPSSYGDVSTEKQDFLNCGIQDASAYMVLRLSGASASSFVSTMTTSPMLQVGHCATSLILSGEGDVIDVVHVARTGAFEYMFVSSPDYADETFSWLKEASELERHGVRAFPDLSLNNETNKLTLFQCEGEHIDDVLSDYMQPGVFLPAVGTVSSVMFDKLPTLVLRPTSNFSSNRYFIFIPPQFAAVFWRSLLSFNQLSCVGFNAVRRADYDLVPGFKKHFAGLQGKPSLFEFNSFVYRSDGFLGARFLK